MSNQPEEDHGEYVIAYVVAWVLMLLFVAFLWVVL